MGVISVLLTRIIQFGNIKPCGASIPVSTPELHCCHIQPNADQSMVCTTFRSTLDRCLQAPTAVLPMDNGKVNGMLLLLIRVLPSVFMEVLLLEPHVADRGFVQGSEIQPFLSCICHVTVTTEASKILSMVCLYGTP